MDTVGGEIRINQVKITVFLYYLCRYIDIEIKGWVLRDGCDFQLFWSDPEYNRRLNSCCKDSSGYGQVHVVHNMYHLWLVVWVRLRTE